MCLAYFWSLVVYGAKVLSREVDARALDQEIPSSISYIYLDGVVVQIPFQEFSFMDAPGLGYGNSQISATEGIACLAALIFLIFCFWSHCVLR